MELLQARRKEWVSNSAVWKGTFQEVSVINPTSKASSSYLPYSLLLLLYLLKGFSLVGDAQENANHDGDAQMGCRGIT